MRSAAALNIRAFRRPLNHAVVLGGSIAGLFAARVLSDHFASVIIIERDQLPLDPVPRKGTPQGHHVHVLLARGRLIADALLSGLSDELLELGAVRLDAGRDLAWHHAGGWRAQHDDGVVFLSMSRPLLESQIAKHVHALANVTVLDDARITGLLSEQGRITGVRITPTGHSAQAREIEADLVVDATGRGSAIPRWLAELGFPEPPGELIGARVAYTSCTFQRGRDQSTRRALSVSGKPSRRNGVIFPIEGDRWIVGLQGFFDDPVPKDHKELLAFARSLAVPNLYEIIHGCEPLSEVKQYRFAGSLRHRYEQLTRSPEGLIILGDAICSFNPVYGQGMTVSALEAETLGQMLTRAKADGGLDPDFARRWFETITPLIDAAWTGVLIEDFWLPELVEQRQLHLLPLQWYMDRVQRATHRSAFATNQFYRVINFLDPPTKLFGPRMMVAVMLAGFGGARGNGASQNVAPRQAAHTSEAS